MPAKAKQPFADLWEMFRYLDGKSAERADVPRHYTAARRYLQLHPQARQVRFAVAERFLKAHRAPTGNEEAAVRWYLKAHPHASHAAVAVALRGECPELTWSHVARIRSHR